MKRLIPSVLLTLSLLNVTAMAKPAVDDGGRGLAIAKEAKLRDFGWGDSTANMQMILRNKQGDTSVQQESVSNPRR